MHDTTSTFLPLTADRLKRVFRYCIGLFVLSQLLFLIYIQFPRGQNFDEFHYVPSAKQFLAMKENQNWEHPPLGKLLMAVGVGLWGDRPIGWRFMSTVFGSLTVVGMFVWAFALFEVESLALWAALITLVNQLLYVQARIGMLDTFMFAFITWALAAFTASWKPGQDTRINRKLLVMAGICLGLGTACKWFTLIPWVACIGLVALVRLLQFWKTHFEDESPDQWYHPTLWKGLTAKDWILCLGVVPLLAYFLTFIPHYIIQKPRIGFLDLFLMQKKMYEGQLRVVSSHPYMSQWADWIIPKRPIWYAFDREDSNIVRGVLLIGNPVVMWSGLLALLFCLWGWIENKSRAAFLILAFYAAFLGSWILIPRKIAFYYYYYPAGTVLSLALAYVFHVWRSKWAQWIFFAAALGMFIYFFPILAALRIPADTFQKWMWLRTWI